MLILTRRVGETVVIGNDVDVTVLGVKGNQVRLGVKAPREISVHREEIYKRIKDETEQSQEVHANGNGKATHHAQGNGHSRGSNGRHNGLDDHHRHTTDS